MQQSIPWEGEGSSFFEDVHEAALQDSAADEPEPATADELETEEDFDAAEVIRIAARMWMSKTQLRGRELSSIIDETIVSDDADSVGHAAVFARSIEQYPTGQGVAGTMCYRGGGLLNEQLARTFYIPGRRFRQPSFFATSFSEAVADNFRRTTTLTTKIRWIVRLDAEQNCRSAARLREYVRGVPDEQEYLFMPFSAFTVLRAAWRSGTLDDPHEIELQAAINSKVEPEDLPLAPCY